MYVCMCVYIYIYIYTYIHIIVETVCWLTRQKTQGRKHNRTSVVPKRQNGKMETETAETDGTTMLRFPPRPAASGQTTGSQVLFPPDSTRSSTRSSSRITKYLLSTTYHLLPTTYCLLPNADCLMPTDYNHRCCYYVAVAIHRTV